jgi:hypothetical protein
MVLTDTSSKVSNFIPLAKIDSSRRPTRMMTKLPNSYSILIPSWKL